jgi:hypothetical protein
VKKKADARAKYLNIKKCDQYRISKKNEDVLVESSEQEEKHLSGDALAPTQHRAWRA